MINKYYAQGWTYKIADVEVESETKSSVKINGKTKRKICSDSGYFDSKEEAVNFLIGLKQKIIDQSERRIAYYKNEINEIRKANDL